VKEPHRFVILLAAIIGCGDDLPGHDTVLGSEHFRLFAYGGARVSAADLQWLENHYSSSRAFLKFQDHLVEYHLFSSIEEVEKICTIGGSVFPACAKGTKVYAARVPYEHELIHAYMAPLGRAPPLLEEGVADGVSCEGGPIVGGWPSWQVVAALPAANQDAVYRAGVALFGFLTRRFGIDAFVEYYGMARPTLDPEIFRLDFEAHWQMPLDEAWQEMQVTRNGTGGLWPICPCTDEKTLPLDGSAIDLGSLTTRVLPIVGSTDERYLFAAHTGVSLRNCRRDYLSYEIASLPERPASITAARLLPESHFLHFDPRATVTARTGGFLAESCEKAEPITIPPGYAGNVSILETRRRDEPTISEWWSRLKLDAPRTLRVRPPETPSDRLVVCSTCDDSAGCTPVTREGGELTVAAPGPEVILRATFALLPETYGSAEFEILSNQ
jgi:hypothetical protein